LYTLLGTIGEYSARKIHFFPGQQKKIVKKIPPIFTFRSGKLSKIKLFGEKIVKISIFGKKLSRLAFLGKNCQD